MPGRAITRREEGKYRQHVTADNADRPDSATVDCRGTFITGCYPLLKSSRSSAGTGAAVAVTFDRRGCHLLSGARHANRNVFTRFKPRQSPPQHAGRVDGPAINLASAATDSSSTPLTNRPSSTWKYSASYDDSSCTVMPSRPGPRTPENRTESRNRSLMADGPWPGR